MAEAGRVDARCRALSASVASSGAERDLGAGARRGARYARAADPDFIIRTRAECRVSNFLLWQATYAEYDFRRTSWPDFTVAEFAEAVTGRISAAPSAIRRNRFRAGPRRPQALTPVLPPERLVPGALRY